MLVTRYWILDFFISGTWILDFLDAGFHKQTLHGVNVYCTYKVGLVVHIKRG